MLLSGALDANVAIGLAKGEVFNHLASLFSPLSVPAAVRHEVVDQAQGRAGATELSQALNDWITEVAPDPTSVQQFAGLSSVADRELLAVAVDQQTDFVLTEDRVVRQEAAAAGLDCLGVSEVVVLMKDQGLIPAVRPVLDRMRQRGFGITDGAYHQALAAAGE